MGVRLSWRAWWAFAALGVFPCLPKRAGRESMLRPYQTTGPVQTCFRGRTSGAFRDATDRRESMAPSASRLTALKIQRHQLGVGVLVYANCTKRSHESVPLWPKRQPVRNGAIAVPDAVAKEDVLEAIGRMGDASIHARYDKVSHPVELSACRHSVI